MLVLQMDNYIFQELADMQFILDEPSGHGAKTVTVLHREVSSIQMPKPMEI
jgi:hypothetical protein